MHAGLYRRSTFAVLAVLGIAAATGCSAHRPYLGLGQSAQENASFVSADHQAAVLDRYQDSANYGAPQAGSYQQAEPASWGVSKVSATRRPSAGGSSCFS